MRPYPSFGSRTVVNGTPGEVTRLLKESRQGNKEAEALLIPLVYEELHAIAARRMRNEIRDHTLQPTALVHEAYLRIAHLQEIDWRDRSHFYALAASMMRHILVDHARARGTAKRGNGTITIALDEAIAPSSERVADLLAIDESLSRLAQIDARQSKIVELRFFAGLTEEETGEALGISARTVKRDWRLARAWLFDQLRS
jgi:RNA polymerase sigma-70 factor, ECF subfamily